MAKSTKAMKVKKFSASKALVCVCVLFFFDLLFSRSQFEAGSATKTVKPMKVMKSKALVCVLQFFWEFLVFYWIPNLRRRPWSKL